MRVRRRATLGALAVSLAIAGAGAGAVFGGPWRSASPPPPAPRLPMPRRTSSLTVAGADGGSATLGTVLRSVAWDADRHGPLLAVDAGRVLPAGVPQGSVPAAPPPARGYRLNLVAPAYGRKIVRLDTLTVLAPTGMVLLNGDPDGLKQLPRGSGPSNLRHLLAVLGPEQWRLLGSARGLGADDLTPALRPLFLSVVPDPFRAVTMAVEEGGATRADFNSGPPHSAETVLPPAARAAVRLRLYRDTFVSLPLQRPGRPDAFSLLDRDGARPDGARFVQAWADWGGGYVSQTLRREVPNRLKPADLAFDAPALRAPIPLAGASTVGELVARAGRAAGMELHADRRVASLPVWSRGGAAAASAGDVLKALCYALTSTFRRVGPAFVLTDDRAGIGARRASLDERADGFDLQMGVSYPEAMRRIRGRRDTLAHVGYAADDPLALSPALVHKIEAAWSALPPEGYALMEMAVEVPTAELPPPLQEAVRRHVVRAASEGGPAAAGVGTERVRVAPDVRLSFLVPGIGEVEAGTLGDPGGTLFDLLPRSAPEPSGDGSIRFPAALGTRAALITPADATTAGRLIAAAADRGFTEVWVEAPEAGEGTPAAAAEVLDASIAAGKARGLPVYGVVRLLRTRQTSGGDAPARVEVTIRGEPASAEAARRRVLPARHDLSEKARPADVGADWLRIDRPAAFEEVMRRLRDLAAAPGLAGLVLRDTAAPGYHESGDDPHSYALDDPRDVGYHEEQRLAFLRQEGIDPIDLIVTGSAGIFSQRSLPFFPETPGDRTAIQRWRAFRNAGNVRFLRALHAAFRREYPGLPLLIRDRSPAFFGPSGWYARWDRAEALPGRTRGTNDPAAIAKAARSQTPGNLLNIDAGDAMADPRGAARFLTELLGAAAGAGWEGVVYDLGGRGGGPDEAAALRPFATGGGTGTAGGGRFLTGAARRPYNFSVPARQPARRRSAAKQLWPASP